MKRRITLLTLFALTLAACGGAETPDTGSSADALVAAESAQALARATETAAPLVERDGAAADVMSAVRDAYGRRMTCADVALSAGLLSVDFGAGCDVNGHTLSGTFTVAHTRTGTSSSFTLSLADLSADGTTVDGTVHTAAEAGTLSADATLMVSDGAAMTELLFEGEATPDSAGIALEGSASRDDGAIARSLAFTGIYVVYGDCYPSAGQVAIDGSGQPTTTVTFSAATPTTGEVSVQVGRLPAQTVTLPACP